MVTHSNFYNESESGLNGYWDYPDSKVHGANMGSTWVLSAPDGHHVGPLNHAVSVGCGKVKTPTQNHGMQLTIHALV